MLIISSIKQPATISPIIIAGYVCLTFFGHLLHHVRDAMRGAKVFFKN